MGFILQRPTFALFPQAPATTVLLQIETLRPNSSPAAPSAATSLARCVHPEDAAPATSRVNTCAEPLTKRRKCKLNLKSKLEIKT